MCVCFLFMRSGIDFVAEGGYAVQLHIVIEMKPFGLGQHDRF